MSDDASDANSGAPAPSRSSLLPSAPGTARDVAKFVTYALLAMCVFQLDTIVFLATKSWAPALALAADLRAPSLSLLLALVLMSRARRALETPKRIDARIFAWSAAWVVGTYFSVHFAGIGKIPLPRWEDAVAMGVTGLFAEELLCRGLVLAAAARVWPLVQRPRTAIVVSAAVFALMHHQYHGYRFDRLAWMQTAWTFPFGILLAWITVRSRSLWPAVGLHLVNNAVVQLA